MKTNKKPNTDESLVEETTYFLQERSLEQVAQHAAQQPTIWDLCNAIAQCATTFLLASTGWYLAFQVPNLNQPGFWIFCGCFSGLVIAIAQPEGLAAWLRANPHQVRVFAIYGLMGLLATVLYAYSCHASTI